MCLGSLEPPATPADAVSNIVETAACLAGVDKKASFRVNRKLLGLTFSAPVDSENPLSKEIILDFMCFKFGSCKFTIGREKHPTNDKYHFHCWFKFMKKIDTTDPRAFDILGVHPSLPERKDDKGKILPIDQGWEDYCVKDGDYITNHYEMDPYRAALEAPSVREAMNVLAKKRPADVCKYGEQIERNIRRRLCAVVEYTIYCGPFPVSYFPVNWNPLTHSLLLWGEPGTHKTQFARYLMSHMFGEYTYIKRKHEQLRKLCGLPFIFDEAYFIDVEPQASREATCVECGGVLGARNTDIEIPPGIPRIFVSNYEWPFHNPQNAVYDRRVVKHHIIKSWDE